MNSFTINKALLSNLTLLYVEDDRTTSEELSHFLSKYVKEVIVAHNGEAGLEAFNSNKIDLIVTDINMPLMNGLDMVEAINDRRVPVILTTAHSDVDYFLQAIDLGITKYCIKPIQINELLRGIQEAVLLQNVQNDLLQNDNLLKIIDENVLLSVTNTNGEIIDVSDALCKLTGYDRSELIGQKYLIFKHEDVEESFYINIWEKLKNGEIFEGEFQNVKKNGDTFWVKITITPTFQNKKVVNYIAIREDITHKKRLEELAVIDELTSLYNRRHFNQIVEKEIRRTKRRDAMLNMLLVDIDYFKKYNDTYGHPKGDKVLVEVSELFQKYLKRADDYIFRIGGEEFCLLFSSESSTEPLAFAWKIVKAIQELNIQHEGSLISDRVTISCGLRSVAAKDLTTDTQMYLEADKALYDAKKTGRNKVVVYEESNKH